MTDAKTLLWATLLFMGGCGSGAAPATPPQTAPTQNSLPSDDAILGKVYAPNVSVPNNFLVDAASQLTGSYTLGHLRSTDLDPQAATAYELCSNDMTQALDWSDTVTRSRGGLMLSATESSRYFEFTRQIAGLDDWVALERVFRCDYLNRDGVDLGEAFGRGGQFNVTPVTLNEVRELAEYLWQFSAFNNPGHAVLESQGYSLGSTLRHALTIASRVPLAGEREGCDLIEIFDWHFDVLPDGAITTSKVPVLGFDARWDGFQAARCVP